MGEEQLFAENGALLKVSGVKLALESRNFPLSGVGVRVWPPRSGAKRTRRVGSTPVEFLRWQRNLTATARALARSRVTAARYVAHCDRDRDRLPLPDQHHQSQAVIHSPAEMLAAWPTVVTRSRCPRAFTRSTQKPLSALWKVTRSTRPTSASRGGDDEDGSACRRIARRFSTPASASRGDAYRPEYRSRQARF